MTKILDKQGVSEAYGWSIWTLNAWRREGRGPRSFRLGGTGRVVYKVEDIESWIEQSYNDDADGQRAS
jgi:predicted DNA-binding transcriptional regulator AlpA